MKTWLWIVLGVVVVGLIVLAIATSKHHNQTMSNQSNPVTSLQISDETVGTGAAAKAGDKLTVNYVGTLTDGTKFDSSFDRNQPYSFTLGAGRVIGGWDQGLVGMKVGGKRKLVIPADLGYGAAGYPPAIPGNATLIFEITLVKIN